MRSQPAATNPVQATTITGPPDPYRYLKAREPAVTKPTYSGAF
jgi:hypothetical protein